MTGNITYYRIHDNIEYIYYHRWKRSYTMHTHANHVTFGYILDGGVCGKWDAPFQVSLKT